MTRQATNIAMDAIGTVKTSRATPEDDYWGGEQSCIELVDGFDAQALEGLELFSHCEVLFLFDRVEDGKIVRDARRPRNNPEWPRLGIFAQRGKNRPNRIGSTICRVLRVEGTTLFVAELDAIDGSPVLDIKPVMREFLPRGELRQPRWVGELMAHYWDPSDERPAADEEHDGLGSRS